MVETHVCYKKQENRHCVDHLLQIYEKSTMTLSDVLVECASDRKCGSVYDYLCDHNNQLKKKGQFYLCKTGSDQSFSSSRLTKNKLGKTTNGSSCLYIKETEYGNNFVNAITLRNVVNLYYL